MTFFVGVVVVEFVKVCQQSWQPAAHQLSTLIVEATVIEFVGCDGDCCRQPCVFRLVRAVLEMGVFHDRERTLIFLVALWTGFCPDRH